MHPFLITKIDHSDTPCAAAVSSLKEPGFLRYSHQTNLGVSEGYHSSLGKPQ